MIDFELYRIFVAVAKEENINYQLNYLKEKAKV